jgi:NHL repeat
MYTQIRRISVPLAMTAFIVVAQAQESQPCVGDPPPAPYHMIKDFTALTEAAIGKSILGNSIFIDSKNHIWLFSRCTESCVGSSEAPIVELSTDGKVIQKFGAGMFATAHGITVDKDGNVWAAAQEYVSSTGGETPSSAEQGKVGPKVVKFSPDGKVLMSLDEPGKPVGSGLDVSDRPAAVIVAPNGDIFWADGHRAGAAGEPQTFGNSRIMKYDKDGKFIKSFGRLGTDPGELMGPHGLAFDSQGRLFVADRSNRRVDIFDQDGNFITSWHQFGGPSGIWVDKNDTLYVSDNLSEANPPKDTMWWPPNPGCTHGIRIGSAKTGKVDYYLPHPILSPDMAKAFSLTWADAEGIALDSEGTIYLKATRAGFYKYVKN